MAQVVETVANVPQVATKTGIKKQADEERKPGRARQRLFLALGLWSGVEAWHQYRKTYAFAGWVLGHHGHLLGMVFQGVWGRCLFRH